ncbi:MAG: transposase [Sebaldella sp.]|nr:transposase [Sebaldella sp.]
MYQELNSIPKTYLNGEIKKYSIYRVLDLEAIMNKLKQGETIEIEFVHRGTLQKLLARLICYRLTEEQLKKRRKKQNFTEKKKGFALKEKNKHLSGLNVYITNIPSERIKKEEIHNLYSLRWQIELLFKTWKSFFGIQHCKKIKKESLECHLYGQLISILISSATMFKIRKLLYGVVPASVSPGAN